METPDGTCYSVKIFETEKIHTSHSFNPGKVFTDGKKYIDIACKDGYIRLKELQLAGKKRLRTEELLRGFNITNDFICL